jgi:hypothetical protein
VPVDAIAEFRILTQSAPPEYGGTAGATTSIVTRSGGNELHGSLYEFVRNDASIEELLRGTGRAVEAASIWRARPADRSSRNRAFFFGYFEGFPQRPGDHDHRHRADRGRALMATSQR